jgi:hypothetical protein
MVKNTGKIVETVEVEAVALVVKALMRENINFLKATK